MGVAINQYNEPITLPALDLTALARLRFFQGVALEPIAAMLQSCPQRQLDAGGVLILPGKSNEWVYVILSGSVHVTLDGPAGAPVAILDAGDAVGELSLLDRQPTAAYVVAATPCRLLAIDEPMFWMLIDSSHGLARNLLFSLAQRLRRNNGAIAEGLRQVQEATRDGRRDALTQLHNRLWLQEVLPREVGRCAREHKPLSIVMLDIDHFKRVNDRFGHGGGDTVLAAVARALQDNLRPSDKVARYGGEEFLAILPGTPLPGAMLVAERLRKAVSDTVIFAANGTPLTSVTLSLGIAELGHGEDTDALIARADAALYRAKRGGRNRYCH